jgi:hypothetical protein
MLPNTTCIGVLRVNRWGLILQGVVIVFVRHQAICLIFWTVMMADKVVVKLSVGSGFEPCLSNEAGHDPMARIKNGIRNFVIYSSYV